MLFAVRKAVHQGIAVSMVLLTAATGCSSNPLNSSPRTIEPAQPALSPPAAEPAGAVRPLGGHPRAALFDGGSHHLVVLSPGADPAGPASIAVWAAGQADPPRVVELPGPATAMAGDGRGTVYLAGRGSYLTLELNTGRTTTSTISDAQGADFTAIARRADGGLMLGSADGAVYTLGGNGSVTNRLKIFARVDALATQGNTTVVLDRGQTSVTAIGADGHAAQALRAGEGATTLAADPQGRVLVADTRGGQLLVYGVDPLILRQAFPVRQAPYGLAGSGELAWVSQTASNTVIGYDLSTGIPVEKVRYQTVQQPNSLAYDESADTLYVVSGSGAGVQIIEHAAGRP
ncbi:YncE family protein [Mycobacterium asiaticum]|uniref:YncE family protein n=1 Tax=Mycobacterium asiaticum TaxID=1790 RepID=UPI003F5151F5